MFISPIASRSYRDITDLIEQEVANSWKLH